MKTLTFKSREEWLAGRNGRVTGSTAGDIIQYKPSTKEKIGFYEIVAQKIAVQAELDEKPMDRGTRLEPTAVVEFEKKTGKKVDTSLVIWTRDDNENIAISPDGFIKGKGKKITEAVEVKCLSSARHIMAWDLQEIPSDYEEQANQYFVVNDDLETLYFVFYDPRVIAMPYFVITLNRKDIKDDVKFCLEQERTKLAKIDSLVNKLTF